MSASIFHPSIVQSTASRTLRFGAASAPGPGRVESTVQWLLEPDPSAAARPCLWVILALSFVWLAFHASTWSQGMSTIVTPVAWIEVLVAGAALVAAWCRSRDSEQIRLQPGRFTVEHVRCGRVERVEFAPAWVRVEPAHGERSLIELSGQGQRISVGRSVRPELRRQLADELRWALRRASSLRPALAPETGSTESKHPQGPSET